MILAYLNIGNPNNITFILVSQLLNMGESVDSAESIIRKRAYALPHEVL